MKARTVLFLMVFFSFFARQSLVEAAAKPEITAKAAVVMDVMTGQVLYSLNGEEKRYPASTTKMMSLIIALESGRLEDVVTTSSAAATTDGSSMWLEAGEQQKLIDLLYGMMLVSGNDATVAVAEHLSGSVPAFAAQMTKKAHEIGAINTKFKNSSGLPDPEHISTAKDLAMIAAYGYHDPAFIKIVSTQKRIMPWAGKPYARELFNENRLLWSYDGANGVKTGYTEAAGPCLVSGALRGGVQLVAVVMDSDSMWQDSKRLLDYGFSKLKMRRVIAKGDNMKKIRVTDGVLGEVDVVAAETVDVPVADAGNPEIIVALDLPSKTAAPVKAGAKIGVARISFEGKVIKEVALLAAKEERQKSLFAILHTFIYKKIEEVSSVLSA